MSYRLILFCLNFLSYTAFSKDYILDPKKRLEIPISSHEITRIYVEGDYIAQVFGLDGRFSLEIEEESGQIFLKPLALNVHDILHLTLVTEEGLTQDLALKLCKDEKEAVCLKRRVVKKNTSLSQSHTPSYPAILLQKIKQSINPHDLEAEGFEELSHSSIPNPVHPSLSFHLQKAYHDDSHVIFVYHIKNITPHSLFLDQSTLASPEDLALALGTRQLLPGQETLLIRLQLKGEMS